MQFSPPSYPILFIPNHSNAKSIPPVFQVFNEKTVAASKTCQKELSISDGTTIFGSLISQC